MGSASVAIPSKVGSAFSDATKKREKLKSASLEMRKKVLAETIKKTVKKPVEKPAKKTIRTVNPDGSTGSDSISNQEKYDSIDSKGRYFKKKSKK